MRDTLPDTKEPRVNHKIRADFVILIDESGKRVGGGDSKFQRNDALRIAQEQGLDLVEVNPNSRPPTCKICDYGKLKYERKKRESAARRNQVQVQTKEVKFRPGTEDHDTTTKVRHARRFLEEGNKVRMTLRFKGRENAHREQGRTRLLELAKLCEDLGVVESPPRFEGRQIFLVIAPLRRKQPLSARRQAREESEKKAAEAPAPEAAEAPAPEAPATEAPASVENAAESAE